MFRKLKLRLRALFHRDDIGDELEAHIEQLTDEFIAQGMSPREARLVAKRQFGNSTLIGERSRDLFSFGLIEDLVRDVHYAGRVLAKSKGFAAVVVLILALGIGANTAAFSFVNAILLKQLPVERPDELVLVSYMQAGYTFAYPDFREIERQNRVFEGMLGTFPLSLHYASGGSASIVGGEMVSGDYFRTLGVHAALGRTLNAEDDGAEGAHPVCVITWQFWQDRFGGDSSAIGRTISLHAQPYRIVGVLERGFRGADLQARHDIFVPTSMIAQFVDMKRDAADWSWLSVMGRLKPGVSMAQAKASIDVLMRPLRPHTAYAIHPAPRGLASAETGMRMPALISLGAVGLVLSIACANIAGLLLARASKRYREMAVRLSLGATRARLVRQLLMECVLLVAAGAAASVAVAAWLLQLLTTFFQKPGSDSALLVGLDGRVLAFTAALAALTLAAFGLMPAWYATRIDVSDGLRDQPFGLARRSGRLRQSLIVVQLALGIVLLFGAGVLGRSLRQLDSLDLGFNPDRVITIGVEPDNSGYSRAAAGELYTSLLDRTRRLPGVQSAALSAVDVLSGKMFAGPAGVPGHDTRRDEPNNYYNLVSTDYFRTLRIPIVRGRDFTDRDRAGAPYVAIVNQRFVQYYWPGQKALGRRIRCFGHEVEIVGVVKTARYYWVREDPQIVIYLPLAQMPFPELTLQARTTAHPELVMAQIRGIVRGLDPKLPVVASALLDQRDASISTERLLAFLSSFLAFLAAALVAVGLYGLVAYSVAARRREIGVRLALGARPASITGMFMRQALAMAALGIALGLPVALACSRLLKSIVFGITPQDPLAMIAGCAVLAVIAAGAAVCASIAGSMQDPVKALRCE